MVCPSSGCRRRNLNGLQNCFRLHQQSRRKHPSQKFHHPQTSERGQQNITNTSTRKHNRNWTISQMNQLILKSLVFWKSFLSPPCSDIWLFGSKGCFEHFKNNQTEQRKADERKQTWQIFLRYKDKCICNQPVCEASNLKQCPSYGTILKSVCSKAGCRKNDGKN